MTEGTLSMPRARGVRPAWLVAASSAWMGTIANAPLWRELQTLHLTQGTSGWLLALTLPLIITGTLAALLSLLAWRRTLKPTIVALLAASAAGAYFMLNYHVVIDPSMIVNMLQTDRQEAFALLSPRLVAALLLLGLLPGWLVWRMPVRHAPWPRQALRNFGMAAFAVLAVACVILLSFEPLSSAMRNHKQLRYLMNPLNTLYALGYEAAEPLRRDESRLEPVGRDARMAAAARPPLLVLVLGETGRADHFGLNGYPRATTPALEAEKVASFANAWSCGTSTAASVPCMFSHLGREAFQNRKYNHENLLDVLDHAGLAVLWLDNQAGCKGVCNRVASVHTPQLKDSELCPEGECLDGTMLRGLDERLAQLPQERRARGVVLVLHQMGSHGPAYSHRSPTRSKRFLPECTSHSLQDCTHEELLNAYDNSIAYTDHVLASTIGWLKRRQADYDTAMLYVADHGESLGEKNLYLHGLPYSIAPDAQKHVPWITWLSPAFEQRSGVSLACLRAQAQQRVTHDHYFHSVLGLLQVRTQVYRGALDAYAGCAAH